MLFIFGRGDSHDFFDGYVMFYVICNLYKRWNKIKKNFTYFRCCIIAYTWNRLFFNIFN